MFLNNLIMSLLLYCIPAHFKPFSMGKPQRTLRHRTFWYVVYGIVRLHPSPYGIDTFQLIRAFVDVLRTVSSPIGVQTSLTLASPCPRAAV